MRCRRGRLAERVVEGLSGSKTRPIGVGCRRAARAFGWCLALCVGLFPSTACASAPDPGLSSRSQVAILPTYGTPEELPADSGSSVAAGVASEFDEAMDATLSQTGAWLVLHDSASAEEAIRASSAGKSKAKPADPPVRAAPSAGPGLWAAVVFCGAGAACAVVGRRRARVARCVADVGLRDRAAGAVRV